MNFTRFKSRLLLSLITVFASIGFWFFFYFHLPTKIGFPNTSLETIFANYDGPNYMAVAKCGYVKSCIGSSFSLPQPHEYYPAHFIGYPLLIRFFHLFTTGPKAMLLATLSGSVFLSLAVFEFFRLFVSIKQSFWLSLVFIFLPARLFVLRLIGAPETWFLALILSSIVAFRKNRYFLAAIFAALAQTFKSPGIILTLAYFVLMLRDLFYRKMSLSQLLPKYFFFLLTPAAILAMFYNYYLQTGDFWAYFHSGDNIHLNSLPYLAFISTRSWIGSIWLEDNLYVYLLSFSAVYYLFRRYRFSSVSLFPFLFCLALSLVAHRDISRYAVPIYPFAFLAFRRFLRSRGFRLIFILLLPAVFLYAVNFVAGNTAPISDWTPYL